MEKSKEYVQNLAELNKEFENLKKLEPQIQSRNERNLGIFYGLLFGILGNLWVTLALNLFDFSKTAELLIFIIVTIVLLFFIWIIKREWTIVHEYYNEKVKIERLIEYFSHFKSIKQEKRR
jgi:uncharacterized protein YacL